MVFFVFLDYTETKRHGIHLDVHNLPCDRIRGYGMGYLKDFSTMFQGIPGFAAMFFGVSDSDRHLVWFRRDIRSHHVYLFPLVVPIGKL